MNVEEKKGKVYHVSKNGCDSDEDNRGSIDKPFLTISRAAKFAYAGDSIIVHEGIYRERVTPPRGGSSDRIRIIYKVAEGEKAEIRGSELIKGWEPLPENPSVWRVDIDNIFFGDFNPFKELIHGDWFIDKGRDHHLGEIFFHGQSLYEVTSLDEVMNPKEYPYVWGEKQRKNSKSCWFTQGDENQTIIWINLNSYENENGSGSLVNPNDDCVEITVRDACFYPDVPGQNYITVQGFIMRHGATNWAAPTAEQMGLVGSHWSKGWIIEDNVISDSRCSGITLGKDRASGNNVLKNDGHTEGAELYTDVIKKAQALGWHKDNIGSHIVRNNVIYNCEMAGISGSMGAIFSEISGNHIYNIHVKSQFTGHEMAGIKIHGAIDCLIKENRIHDSGSYGIWLDWMAQGTRVAGNHISKCRNYDLYLEVNFGPNLIDNNQFLSRFSIMSVSEGGGFYCNYIAGDVSFRKDPARLVPRLKPHSTEIQSYNVIEGGDEFFLNNVFKCCEGDNSGDDAYIRLRDFEVCKHPVHIFGNVFE